MAVHDLPNGHRQAVAVALEVQGHVHLVHEPAAAVPEAALLVDVQGHVVLRFDAQPDSIEAQFVGELDQRPRQLRAYADLLFRRRDDHEDLALLAIDGEQGRMPDHALLEGKGYQVGGAADHAPDPLRARLVRGRWKSAEGVPRLIGQVHVDQMPVMLAAQRLDQDCLAPSVDESTWEIVDRGVAQIDLHGDGSPCRTVRGTGKTTCADQRSLSCAKLEL